MRISKNLRTVSAARWRRQKGLSMIEILVVVAIIAILATFSYTGYRAVINSARASLSLTNMKGLATATIDWSAEHGGKIPSPEYPGDMPGGNPPLFADWVPDAQGQWLGGVLYARLYADPEVWNQAKKEGTAPTFDDSLSTVAGAEAGGHLQGTIFECPASVKKFPQVKDWYQHSFAMNANLEPDGIYSGGSAWLTEKTLGRFDNHANAMLFIDCMSSNVVMASDIGAIEEAAERYNGKYVIACYLDGHAAKVKPAELPGGDIYSDEDASRFWRGVKPQN